mmetsp:Transcript_5138/g.14782  ORF Transcript_5138/g.14782 Transcript_5138/m.14782 type:complete len:436 (+) Transcript_5138:231-1538(+)|eukprot:CAMPEP_0206142936 /NCGR_PEP_ID=MMETSP1473-20131121/18760_1 /ASSEMBLY_ACC=CAM_ASM_001109 /TAXON_ID=1461547 /ORGANISM="Stichococcus sp, Strain RCC1054" /LENGTH=435 /DNA_ID=CAMNT_0053538121 /DNA_START=130 /DNA_END=1437 /DNA_ORIENTATION=+
MRTSRVVNTCRRKAKALASLGGLLVFASWWLLQTPTRRFTFRADSGCNNSDLSHHHLEATNDTLRSCPVWEDVLPGAWTVQDVRSGQGEALHGTSLAQRELFRHQNPQDCSNARFLVHKSQLSGIGSMIHQASIALAAALDTDRVMIFQNPDSHVLLSDDYCHNMKAMDVCYFLPISNCTKGLQVPADIPSLDWSKRDSALQVNEKFLLENQGVTWPRYTVPRRFEKLLEYSHIPAPRRYYWWRAQAAAYVVRLNERAANTVRQLRAQRFDRAGSLQNAISVHIRRGDKWRESAPTSDAEYDFAATYLYDSNAASCQGSTCLGRKIFLSTEDPVAIDFFVNHTRWGVRYVDNPAILKPDTQKWSHEWAAEIGPSKDMLGSLLNLQLAIECSGWVGTLSSNWCRLIDQMRATVGCKAHMPFVDASKPNAVIHDLGP